MGFAVSTVATVLAAWFGYIAGRSGRNVPTGTPHIGHCYPQDCDHDCPHSIVRNPEAQAAERARLASIRRANELDPGHSMMCDCDLCLRAFGG